jgi:PPM family protein phosphatase
MCCGVAEQVVVELTYHPAAPGDTYLLCSDGLTRQVSQARISELTRNTAQPLRNRCTALVDATEAAGGDDNATVLLIHLRGYSTRRTLNRGHARITA